MGDEVPEFDREQWDHLPRSERPAKLKNVLPASHFLNMAARFLSVTLFGAALGMMIIIGQLVEAGVLPGSVDILRRWGVWHTLAAGGAFHAAGWLIHRYSEWIDERLNDWFWAAITSGSEEVSE